MSPHWRRMAVMSIGISCMVTSAIARPPAHAPAYGWRGHHNEYHNGDAHQHGHDDERHGDNDHRRVEEYQPGEVVEYVRKPRHQYRYTYYPREQVYYSQERHSYFWLEGGTWRAGAQLPSTILLGTPQPLELDTDRPYTRHAEIMLQFPLGR